MEGIKDLLMVMISLIMLCAVVYEVKRSIKHADYDERQAIIRGKGYAAAFYVMTFLNAVMIVLAAMEIKIMTFEVYPAIQLYVGMCVFVIYCTLNDAYFTKSDKAKFYPLFLAVVGIVELIAGLFTMKEHKIIENGMLTVYSFCFIIGASFLLLAVVFAIKMYLIGQEDDDE